MTASRYPLRSMTAVRDRAPRSRAVAVAVLLPLLAGGAVAQQVPDTDFAPPIPRPAFPEGEGPIVLVDAAHNNFHTADGRYSAFAALLRRDGFVVESSDQPFTRASLARAAVLVIANAIADENVQDWVLPTPSAFSPAEIEAVEEWVAGGGALLLIADHMPIAGNAEALAAVFGLRFYNGFAFDEDGGGQSVFSRARGSLRAHPITDGRTGEARVDSVMTFTGQAFRADADADVHPLIVLPEGFEVLLPSVAWEFSDTTPRVAGAGLLQAAALEYGRGRVAVFGEAAMFSAGPERRPIGMNHPIAGQNHQLVLNALRWLVGNR